MNYLFVFTLVVLSSVQSFGWGAPDLLPSGDRTKTYTVETMLDKKKGFAKVSIWAAKTFVNANEAVKLKDADSGTFVVKGNLSCKALKIGNGYADNQRIDFTLEITVADKSVESKITDLVGHASGSAYDDGSRPSTKAEMAAAVSECTDPFIETLKKELQ